MLQRSFVIPLHKTSVFTLLFIVRRTHQCGVKLSYATIESYMFQPLWVVSRLIKYGIVQGMSVVATYEIPWFTVR